MSDWDADYYKFADTTIGMITHGVTILLVICLFVYNVVTISMLWYEYIFYLLAFIGLGGFLNLLVYLIWKFVNK